MPRRPSTAPPTDVVPTRYPCDREIPPSPAVTIPCPHCGHAVPIAISVVADAEPPESSLFDTAGTDNHCKEEHMAPEAALAAVVEAVPSPGTSVRRPLQPTSVLSTAQAVRALPWREADARAWLRREGLVHRVDGRDVVIWGDVLDRIRQDSMPVGTWQPIRVPAGTPRARID